MKKIILLLSLITVCSCNAQNLESPPEKPKGYWSNLTLKFAYITGRLDLIELDFPLPDNIQEHKDIIYKTIDSLEIKLDIYHQKNITEATPLIIFIHGGAWKKGNKHDYWPYLIPYAEKGYITATIQYRLLGDAIYPAQLDDVESAILWLTKNAETYHIDTNKIALVGGSAGAHLAMMAAYTKPELNIKGVVNLYGPSDLTTEYSRNADQVISLIGQSFEEAPELYRQASPMTFVTKNIPPTLTFQGTLDDLVPYEQSDNLDKKITEVGAISHYHKLKGWPHTMDLSVKVNQYCQYYMDDFFEKYIAK